MILTDYGLCSEMETKFECNFLIEKEKIDYISYTSFLEVQVLLKTFQ